MNHTAIQSEKPEVSLRSLTNLDLPFCAKLVKQAGWNQIEGDWRRVMELDPEGCFVAEKGGVAAGTIVFTRFFSDDPSHSTRVAWISMVLVDTHSRGQGIGRDMFGQVLDKLRLLDIDTIRLDATEMGVNLYRKYGFREEYELIRLFCNNVRLAGQTHPLSDRWMDVDSLTTFDYNITGTNRRSLINSLLHNEDALLLTCSRQDGGIKGYAGIRPGRTGWQIGPCLAEDYHRGEELLDKAVTSVIGQKTIIDIPASNVRALHWAGEHGFREQRRFIRMYTGKKIADHPENIWASFGPEKG